MSFCTKCGAELRDGDVFCAKCGANMGSSVNSLVEQNIAQNMDAKVIGSETDTESRSSGPSGRSIAALVWAIILGPIGLILGISEYSKKDGRSKGLAIAAIIVGVVDTIAIIVSLIIAIPILAKRIEKSNVESDEILCDSIRTAITTAFMDPSIIRDSHANFPTTYGVYQGFNSENCGRGAFQEGVEEILGFPVNKAEDHIKSSYKGSKASGIQFKIEGNDVSVRIINSDSTGNKGKNGSNPIEVTSSNYSWW